MNTPNPRSKGSDTSFIENLTIKILQITIQANMYIKHKSKAHMPKSSAHNANKIYMYRS